MISLIDDGIERDKDVSSIPAGATFRGRIGEHRGIYFKPCSLDLIVSLTERTTFWTEVGYVEEYKPVHIEMKVTG